MPLKEKIYILSSQSTDYHFEKSAAAESKNANSSEGIDISKAKMILTGVSASPGVGISM